MSTTRRWLAVLLAVLIPVAFLVIAEGCRGAGPLGAIGVSETRIEPQDVALPGEGGDPHVVGIGFVWTKDGWCSGQFRVHATETATEIRVGAIVSREYRYFGSCAGVGTVDNRAVAELHLAAPVGTRRIFRASDGAELPIYRL